MRASDIYCQQLNKVQQKIIGYGNKEKRNELVLLFPDAAQSLKSKKKYSGFARSYVNIQPTSPIIRLLFNLF